MNVRINKAAVRLLIVEDDFSQRDILAQILSDEGYSVEQAAGGEEAVGRLGKEKFQVVITDLKMPGKDGLDVLRAAVEADESTLVVLMTAYGTVETAVTAMKAGATDYLTKPLNKDELLIVLEKALKNSHLAQENINLHRELESRYRFDRIIGASPAMNEVYRLIGKVLDNNSTVLVSGESGTGKELVARAIHYNGARRGGPFVAVNCGAIPENLIESELFGHEKGSFSGATGRRIGKFEAADGGTLFLDEISTLQYDLQAKFLRVLQEREFARVGGDQTLKVDVRIITATNQDLRQLAAEGRFRPDLFHRLNVVNINLPPLRARRGDIPLLVRSFLDKYARQYERKGLSVSLEAVEGLAGYDWPGNVRELENLIEQLVVLADEPRIGAEHLPGYIFESGEGADGALAEAPAVSSFLAAEPDSRPAARGNTAREDSSGFRLPAGGVKMEEVEKSFLLQALEQSGGRLVGAARLLGISYKTLQYRIKKFEIDVEGMKP
ncbi:sigma-54 dependent transcriptional regulator [bacterium]|nr:sigma-54 dependent transcriptional regulator [bacterium]